MTTISWDGKKLCGDTRVSFIGPLAEKFHPEKLGEVTDNHLVKIVIPEDLYVGDDKIRAVGFAGFVFPMMNVVEERPFGNDMLSVGFFDSVYREALPDDAHAIVLAVGTQYSYLFYIHRDHVCWIGYALNMCLTVGDITEEIMYLNGKLPATAIVGIAINRGGTTGGQLTCWNQETNTLVTKDIKISFMKTKIFITKALFKLIDLVSSKKKEVAL